jgi:dTDP-4-amino-4,6-dideoxygalactose transaminase
MITVTKTTLPPLERYLAYLERIWQSGQLTNSGPLSAELAEQLKVYLGVANLDLLGNGTLALQLAIRALGLSGQIITTPYSYAATTNAILWEGCEPVFVDIEPGTFSIHADSIERAVTDKTTAILVTHVYGHPCDVDRIDASANRLGLKVIYDAAHAFGVSQHGRSLLDHGDCSALSFHATKVFHTAEGGAVISRDRVVGEKIALMSRFGHTGEEHYETIGINAKLSELHAAMGLALLPDVPAAIQVRRQCSEWYDEFLDGVAVTRPRPPAGVEYNYAYYPVVFDSHDSMMRARRKLLDEGVGPRRYFYPALNTLPFLPVHLRRPCPVAEDLVQRVLVLPVSHQIDAALAHRISRSVAEALA